jgi:hypothetical protein
MPLWQETKGSSLSPRCSMPALTACLSLRLLKPSISSPHNARYGNKTTEGRPGVSREDRLLDLLPHVRG